MRESGLNEYKGKSVERILAFDLSFVGPGCSRKLSGRTYLFKGDS